MFFEKKEETIYDAIIIGAGIAGLTTAFLPSFFPPFKQLYQLLLGLSAAFGGVIGLLILFVN